MAATTTLLGLVTPTQGTLSGTWGDTVNYGISDYVDISVAGTLTLTNDGAVTLANTTGSSSGNSITSSLTGAGTVTAQFAIVKVTGTLTTAKVVTGPSYSKTYTVVNSATGGIVTFKASGQTGVSIAVGESAFVYFNGTDYVKIVGTATAGAAGGSTTQVQYNNAGVLAGITGATTNGTALTLVAPILGTPASATLTNATGLPISTGVSGLGTGIATALAVNTGSAGAPVLFNGALGTPSSGTVTNLTGTASININGTVGATTATTGAFTTVATTDNITITKATGVPRIQLVATTGTNEAYFQTTNTGGSYYFGAENSTGSWFGATAYALAISAPAGRVVDTLIAGSKKTSVSAGGLEITGTLSVSGVATFSAGTAAIPAINTTGDTNTGIFFPAADTIAFSEGGAEAARITSAGDFLLGTTTSSGKITALLAGSHAFNVETNGTTLGSNGGVLISNYLSQTTRVAAINLSASASNAGDIIFGTASGGTLAERARIDSSGNVGIGTTSPATQLEVRSSSDVAVKVVKTGTAQFQIGADSIAYAASDSAMTFRVGGLLIANEKMRIDTSGNLGLGVTPSAWGSGSSALQNSAGSIWRFGTDNIYFGQNYYFNGTNRIYSTTNNATEYQQGSGLHRWYTAPSGTAGNAITFTQAMTLDASGNLGVGTTAQASRISSTGSSSTDFKALTLRNSSGTTGSAAVLNFEASSGTEGDATASAAQIKGIREGTGTAGALAFWTSSSGTSAERARIDSSGNFLVGATTALVSAANRGNITINGTSSSVLAFGVSAATKAYIYSDGTNLDINNQANGYIIFDTNAVERVRITSTGLVGIGTSSPDVPLTIKGGANTAIKLISDSGTGTTATLFGSSNAGVRYGTLTLNRSDTSAITTIISGDPTENSSFANNVLVGGTAVRGTTVGTKHLDLFNGTAPAGTLTNGISLYSDSGDFKFMDAAGSAYTVGFRNVPQSGSSKTASYTLATTDVGEYILLGASGAIVIPDATFAAGDVITIFNNTASTATLTCSITTAYIAGTFTDKATMTLAAAGVATVLFITSTLCVVSGNVT